MSVLNGLKSMFVGADDDYENEDTGHIRETQPERSSARETREPRETRDGRGREVKMIETTTTLQIVLARPNDFSEVKSIGDDLNDQKTVLLNLESVKGEDARRILDFLSGVAYANGADIKMMAQKTFAIMPKNVGFQGVDLMSELENNGYSF